MCEFNVIFKGEIVFKDVIYVKADANKVTVKDVLGDSKEFKNCKIFEINVNTSNIILSV